MASPTKIDWAGIGRYMYDRRLAAGWTQRQAAQAASVSFSTWTELENVKKRNGVADATLSKIANAFNDDPAELLKLAGRASSARAVKRTRTARTTSERLEVVERSIAELNRRYDEIIARLERDQPRASRRGGGRPSTASP